MEENIKKLKKYIVKSAKLGKTNKTSEKLSKAKDLLKDITNKHREKVFSLSS